MFVIVRHGNTFAAGEAPRRIGARTDLPLTETGKEQARTLGAYFAANGWQFDRALVAPLLRTRDTASLIIEQQAEMPQPIMCDWLREIDHGPDENRSEAEVVARIGQEALDRWDHDGAAPPGWIVDRDARLSAWQELFADPVGANTGPTLVVTSNGAARFALLAAPYLAASRDSMTSLKLPTGGFGVIQRNSAGKLEVTAWGQRP